MLNLGFHWVKYWNVDVKHNVYSVLTINSTFNISLVVTSRGSVCMVIIMFPL